MKNEKQLILASASPRRQELLREAGIDFTVEIPDVEECDANSNLSPSEIAKLNAMKKAQVAAAKHPQEHVLAADTIVVCDGKIMGKPSDENDARKMLRWMGGKRHEVLTGVVWLCLDKKIERKDIIRSQVTFKKLDEKIISDYIKAVHVLDKAGAYALQEHGEMIIERVEGSRSNVIGLPMEIVKQWINENL